MVVVNNNIGYTKRIYIIKSASCHWLHGYFTFLCKINEDDQNVAYWFWSIYLQVKNSSTYIYITAFGVWLNLCI